jgi:thioredoxin 1
MRRMKAIICLVVSLFTAAALLMLPLGCTQGDSGAWAGSTPLEEALANGKPTVAEFGAATCIPCKRMKPILEELAAEHGDKINVSFVDVWKQTDVANQYRITLIPTQVFFDSSGNEVTRHTGFWPKEEILTQLGEMGVV